MEQPENKNFTETSMVDETNIPKNASHKKIIYLLLIAFSLVIITVIILFIFIFSPNKDLDYHPKLQAAIDRIIDQKNSGNTQKDVTDDLPAIIFFEVSPTRYTTGTKVNISWKTANAKKVFINENIGEVALEGNEKAAPVGGNFEYVLTATNDFGSISKSINMEAILCSIDTEFKTLQTISSDENTKTIKLGQIKLDKAENQLHATLNTDLPKDYSGSVYLILVDPLGREATVETYPGSSFFAADSKDSLAYDIIFKPIAGVWAALVKGKDLSNDGSKYCFVASVRD